MKQVQGDKSKEQMYDYGYAKLSKLQFKNILSLSSIKLIISSVSIHTIS